jgi:hypothetical protein
MRVFLKASDLENITKQRGKHDCYSYIRNSRHETTNTTTIALRLVFQLSAALEGFELVAAGALPIEVPEVPPELPLAVPSRITTYISPVASELKKSRPCLSKAIPTGLKQLLGHTQSLALAKMSVVEVLLSEAATGSPLRNGITESL